MTIIKKLLERRTTVKPDTELSFVSLCGNKPSEVIGTVTMPTLRLIDREFKYRPSCNTDLAETFKRARNAHRLSEVPNNN